MNDFTFVIASLNNGYDNSPNDPVINFHFERTVYCVNRLVEKLNARVIFVDWCSDKQKIFKKYLKKSIGYIHVPDFILDELHKNNEATMLFYEWIAKDIGAYFVNTKNILFTNGDNLFSTRIINELQQADTDMHWYSGLRINVDNNIFLEENLEQRIHEVPPTFNIIHECDFCHGDFTLVSKKNYHDFGGYDYSHRHAYEDTAFCLRLEANSITQKKITTPFFHINHTGTGKHFISSPALIDKEYIKQLILKNIEIDIL